MKKAIKSFGLNTAVIAFIGLMISIPYFSQLNNLILDRLQGGIQPREDIVIVGIDDKTLGEIGAWPWTREKFAKALYELDKNDPKVVSFDILFLEEREGDEEFRKAINAVNFPVVLGSKILEGNLYESIFKGGNASSGYTNFVPDADTKIRRTTIATEINNECLSSFAFSTLKSYIGINKQHECNETIELSSRLQFKKDLQFLYPENSFSFVSFSDLYNGNIKEEEIKGKIVLIGSTATDLKSGLLDNFTDVFGQTRPGVSIHASIINSFLDNRFQKDLANSVFFPLIILISSIMFFLYKISKRSWLEAILFLGILFIMNVAGLVMFDYGTNWPILQTNILLISGYVFFIAYKYLVESKEKRFIKQAFGKYINQDLLKQLLDKPESLKLGGEKKEITVLFSDIQGYTSVAEKLSPEELLEFTNSYFDVETNVIIKNNGTIDKYIGDAIMAFWNAPADDPEHKLNAIKAALGMQKALTEFNKIHPDLPDIHCGVGINTDLMIVGNMGSTKRYNYTLIGDGVNLGSRIEGLTRKYGVKIIVTENVLKDLDMDKIQFIPRILDEVKVKGKDISVRIYEVMDNNQTNHKIKELYEKAFEKYQSGNFDDAVQLFTKISEDPPSQVLLERIPEVKNLKKWKGIWTWEKK